MRSAFASCREDSIFRSDRKEGRGGGEEVSGRARACTHAGARELRNVSGFKHAPRIRAQPEQTQNFHREFLHRRSVLKKKEGEGKKRKRRGKEKRQPAIAERAVFARA